MTCFRLSSTPDFRGDIHALRCLIFLSRYDTGVLLERESCRTMSEALTRLRWLGRKDAIKRVDT